MGSKKLPLYACQVDYLSQAGIYFGKRLKSIRIFKELHEAEDNSAVYAFCCESLLNESTF